jgi:hypothetical protein
MLDEELVVGVVDILRERGGAATSQSKQSYLLDLRLDILLRFLSSTIEHGQTHEDLHADHSGRDPSGRIQARLHD